MKRPTAEQWQTLANNFVPTMQLLHKLRERVWKDGVPSHFRDTTEKAYQAMRDLIQAIRSEEQEAHRRSMGMRSPNRENADKEWGEG